jgi:hypothetical protein
MVGQFAASHAPVSVGPLESKNERREPAAGFMTFPSDMKCASGS